MRKTVKVLALAMTVVLSLGFVGCGNKKEDTKKEDTKKETQVSEENKKEEEKKPFATVGEYIKSEEMQTALSSMKEKNTENMSIDVIAEGDNKLVYVYTYTQVSHTENDGMAEPLESAVTAQDSTFESVVDAISGVVACENIMVEVRYQDKDGVLIYSKTYGGAKQ